MVSFIIGILVGALAMVVLMVIMVLTSVNNSDYEDIHIKENETYNSRT